MSQTDKMEANELLDLLPRLKSSRRAAKGWVTKRGNEIRSKMSDFANINIVKEKLPILHETMNDFRSAHKSYHELLSREEDLEDSSEYINDAEQCFLRLDGEIKAWLNDAELLYLGINSDAKSDAGSIRSLGSRASHNTRSAVSKATSSTSSAKARAMAKKAILEAEAATLKKLQEIEEEELRLRQRKRKLEFETKLAKADAEERAYAQLEAAAAADDLPPSNESKFETQYPIPPPIDTPLLPQDTPPPPRDATIPPRGSMLPPRDVKGHDEGPRLLKTEQRKPIYESPSGYETLDTTPYKSEDFLCRMLESQRLQTLNIQHLLGQQQRHTLALTLPQPQVPIFGGDPVEYCTFVRAFESVIEAKTVNERDRLYYLVQYTTGEVQELVRSCLAMSEYEGYAEARRLLRERYGQGYRIAAAYVERLTKGQSIRAEDNASLQKFSISLTSCTNTLKEIGYLSKLDNPDSMKRIIDKLPYGLRLKWRDTVDGITQREQREVSIEDITRFVADKARAASHPVFGRVVNSDSKSSHVMTSQNPKQRTADARKTIFATQSLPARTSIKCVLCQKEHWLSKCQAFKDMSVGERSKFVQEKSLCGNCLVVGHFLKNCPKSSFCKVNACTGKHSTFLHPTDGKRVFSKPDESSNVQSIQDNSSSLAPKAKEGNNGYVGIDSPRENDSSKIALAIVPVTVRAKGQATSIKTYAFLDNGSNASFCTTRLMKQLKINGRKTLLSLATIEGKGPQKNCSLVDLEVLDLEENNHIDLLDVFSTNDLPVSTENKASAKDLERWPHLAGIELPHLEASVDLLIGCDVPQALQPEEIRKGRKGEPYATRTIFGWAINGPLGRDRSSNRTSNLIKADLNLSKQFESYCNMEFNDSLSEQQTALSQQDKRVLKMMEDTVKLKDGHYELALPWKQDPPSIDNNKHVAQHRLQLLRKRLLKDPHLSRMYADFIDNLLVKGYARKVTDKDQAINRTWYLPHHPVFHPKKPNKIRVVFDCSAKYKGKSLNDQLLQGPDLTNTLFGVLTRFRQEPVAFMSDVEAMFHQVRVREEDCNALRFLWWPDGDLSKDAEEFMMTVHLFGGTSSPSCSNFALRRTADDNAEKYDPEAIYTVKNNFYVDDCLKSVATDDAAIRLIEQLRNLLAEGGFHLTKWLSNSAAVIESVPEEERAPSTKTLDFETPHLERALGVNWNVSTDTFGFKISVKDKPATRRGILSIVSSIYDPLGFAAPFTLHPKILLQDLCRKRLGWDDDISEEDSQRWEAWLQDLPIIEKLSVNRCVKPNDFGEIVSSQLHHFSDASQEGYGAVSYLRMVNHQGRIHCSFLTGKSRLAPLKTLTVPRMELSAAVLSTRLDQMIRRELTIALTDTSLFWTDSTCVLSYIENESARFHTFVANRISSIRDSTSPTQWKYVDTKSNPADDASRGLSPKAAAEDIRWIKGPGFLWQPEETWPQRPANITAQVNDPEIKNDVTSCATCSSTNDNIMFKLFEHFSCWTRLRKFVAWLLRYKSNLKQSHERRQKGEPEQPVPIKAEPITVEEMKIAEREILKLVQRGSFQEEIETLKKTETSRYSEKTTVRKHASVKQTSSLQKLDPFLKDDLLLIGGRLRNAPICDQAKHQVILPKRHHVVELIIRHYHAESGHSGAEHVLSMIRELFWIIKARVAIRRVLGLCLGCKKRSAKVNEQKMADLPLARVTPSNPPFTFVGVDCFGPMLVRRGRSTVKRYGVLFTCMTIRAVHIEIAHSMDTDSFINSLRRFIARRGPPQEMRSDNGTNFVGGQRELREAIENWNQQKIHHCLLGKSVKWIFNPPSASHHGGVWERCIRSTRKILQAILKEQTMCDESLSTMMCEVEAILNGRPLTKVSDDPNDLEALTPNHLLLLRKGNTLPPGVFCKEDSYSRRRWRQVQYLADVFWRRWIKEYLPGLQCRQKWSRAYRNLQPNDVVLVVDDTAPRSSWPLGRILEVYRNSADGLVRSVKVKTKMSTYVRPVDKIVLLEAAEV